MDEFIEEISSDISILSAKAKMLFGALTVDLLYPNYVAFVKNNDWGSYLVLRDAVSFVFKCLINDKPLEQEVKDTFTKVESVTPDTEDFPGILTSFALDACTSLLDILQFILDKDEQHIVDIATYARDTVDMFIQEKDSMRSTDPSIDIQIEHDDFMLQEKERQRDLISMLSTMNLDVITDDLINKLRSKKPIIDLSLVS